MELTSTQQTTLATPQVVSLEEELAGYTGDIQHKAQFQDGISLFHFDGPFAVKPDTKTPAEEYVTPYNSSEPSANIADYITNMLRWAKICLPGWEPLRQKLINGVLMSPADKATCARYRADDRPGFSPKILTGITSAQACKDAVITIWANFRKKDPNAVMNILSLALKGSVSEGLLPLFSECHKLHKTHAAITPELVETALLQAVGRASPPATGDSLRHSLHHEIRLGKAKYSEVQITPAEHLRIMETAVMAIIAFHAGAPQTVTTTRAKIQVNEQRLMLHDHGPYDPDYTLQTEERHLADLQVNIQQTQDRIHEAQLQVNQAYL
jgi:hypothetical protein